METLSFTTVLGALKIVQEIAKTTKNVQLNQVTIDLQFEILELQNQVMILQSERFATEQENRDLVRKIEELKDTQMLSDSLELRNDAYWKVNGDGPFCTACHDKDQRLIRLHADGNPAYASCPVCKVGHVKARPELDEGCVFV